MDLLNTIYTDLIMNNTIFVFFILVITFLFAKKFRHNELKRVIGIFMIFLLHIILIVISSYLKHIGSSFSQEANFVSLLFLGFVIVSSIGLIVFKFLLPKLKVNPPLIMQDLVIAGLNILVFFTIASKNGYNLSGLIATSAVITAIIGFSLQDALVNIMGGLSVQLDNSIKIGDWIKIDDKLNGRVVEIRWRHTAIETRNWETVIIPNSYLVKSPVFIIGKRENQPTQWRRWVYFYVDFSYSPSEIIEIVEKALRQTKINNVSDNPKINCIVMGVEESTCRYAVRYWLTDLVADDPTDSEVRIIIYNALMRLNIHLAIPIQSLLITNQHTEQKEFEEINKRIELIEHLELFNYMEKEELESIASQLKYAPFKKGEIITKIGAESHWLYILARGTVSINIPDDENVLHEIAKLNEITFFGEMSLMTGEKRSATVIASTNVECYRLNKGVFHEVIHKRPEIAEIVAEVLAKRRTELEEAKSHLTHEEKTAKIDTHKNDLLNKIRLFFGLNNY
ncbi:MAG: mechanosensitive ion channel family protein [Candidatus Sericytochromatia bacterium]